MHNSNDVSYSSFGFGYIYFSRPFMKQTGISKRKSLVGDEQNLASLSTHDVVLPDNKWVGGLIEQQCKLSCGLRPTIIGAFHSFSTKACPRCNKLIGVQACVEDVPQSLPGNLPCSRRTTAVYVLPSSESMYIAMKRRWRNEAFLVCNHVSDSNASRCPMDNRVAASKFVYFQ